MKQSTIAVVACIGIYTLVFIGLMILYGIYSKESLYNIIETKQTVKSIYIPPGSPKSPIIIPKKLFQTWHSKTLPTHMQKNVDAIQRQNPELEYFLFDDAECIRYIQTHFSDDVVNAYNKLLPGAYKADLWRYCVMYIDGGVYLDVKYKCMDGFKFIDIMDREHFVLERPGFWKKDTYGIYNALIIAKPGNMVFLDAINHIVKYTQTNYYGMNALYPTGPGLLGELYFGNIYDNMNKLKHFDLIFDMIDGIPTIIYKNSIILQCYDEYRSDQKNTQTHSYYVISWIQRTIYAP